MEKKSLTVKTASRAEYENLRIRLVKLYSAHRKVMADLDDSDESRNLSLCARRDADSGITTFEIAVRKKTEQIDFEIVDNGNISET